MADITAGMVKELRERTGLGMMECKKALEEAGGDMKKAEDLLRIKSGAKAGKMAGRVAAEGAIGVHVSGDGKLGALVEINCETDFVAKDANFAAFVKAVAQLAATRGITEVDALGRAELSPGQTVEAARQALVMKLGENLSVRRIAVHKAKGKLAYYLHGTKIGVMLDMEGGANLDSLEQFIDPANYLMPTSDIASLMVFEHQIAAHQAFTRANHECRRMLSYQRGLQESFKQPFTDEPAFDSVKSVFSHNAEHVLDVLLYKDESALPDGGVRGNAFRAAYEAGGRRTADGRSLRDLDLKTRIARYRCSHLIYSEQFAQLPKPLLTRVLDRLGHVLSDPKPEPRYAYLGDDERKAIASIIRETAPELAAAWPK